MQQGLYYCRVIFPPKKPLQKFFILREIFHIRDYRLACQNSAVLDFNLISSKLKKHVFKFTFVLNVLFLLAFFYPKKRGPGNIKVAILNNLRHLSEEKSQKKRPYMRSVNISISHNNNFVVTGFCNIKVFCAYAGAQRCYQNPYLLRAQHFVKSRLFNIQYLPFQR